MGGMKYLWWSCLLVGGTLFAGTQDSEFNVNTRYTVETVVINADGWTTNLAAEDLVADAVKVIRNHETQESKGFAFVEAPTADEMAAIIRRFDRAPLEDRLLRANPAQPPKGKDAKGGQPAAAASPNGNRSQVRNDRKRRGGRDRDNTPRSAFATELAKVL